MTASRVSRVSRVSRLSRASRSRSAPGIKKLKKPKTKEQKERLRQKKLEPFVMTSLKPAAPRLAKKARKVTVTHSDLEAWLQALDDYMSQSW